MARPKLNKTQLARHKLERLKRMTRKAEEDLHALETKEVQAEYRNAASNYANLAMKVDVCNRRQLDKERGMVSDYLNPFSDIERFMVTLQARLKGNGGV